MQASESMNLCSVCHNKFPKNALLCTDRNHYFCSECFKREYCNVPEEASPRHQTTGKSESRRPKKMFLSPEMYCAKRLQSAGEGSNLKSSVISQSKRPLLCPHMECNKYVGVSGIESHFSHEHKDVPMILTHLDSRSALEFSPKSLNYGVKKCIVVLKLVKENNLPLVESNSGTIWSRSPPVSARNKEPQLILTLIATRISPIQLMENELSESDKLSFRSMEAPVTNSNVDKVILWVGSNVKTTLTYTIAASTLENDIRVKYCGPILHINEDPVSLCKEGKVLVLSHHHCVGMTNDYAKSLSLDVVLHDLS